MHRHLVLLISIFLLILSCFIRYYDYLRTWIACLRARPSIAKRKHKNKSYQYPFLTKRPDCQLCQAEEKLPSEVMPPEPSPLITHAVELPVFQVHGDYYAGNIGVQNGPIVGIFDWQDIHRRPFGNHFGDRNCNHSCNCASSIYKSDGIIVSFDISRYEEPKTLGEFIRERRFENDLFAKELASLIGVTKDTVLNWEKDRTCPSQRKVTLLKERLDIDPFELIELDGAISGRQKSIFSLITERGPITRGECQELLGLRQQYAQNDLYFLYRLGVPGRTMGQRRKAKYFLSRDTED